MPNQDAAAAMPRPSRAAHPHGRRRPRLGAARPQRRGRSRIAVEVATAAVAAARCARLARRHGFGDADRPGALEASSRSEIVADWRAARSPTHLPRRHTEHGGERRASPCSSSTFRRLWCHPGPREVLHPRQRHRRSESTSSARRGGSRSRCPTRKRSVRRRRRSACPRRKRPCACMCCAPPERAGSPRSSPAPDGLVKSHNDKRVCAA